MFKLKFVGNDGKEPAGVLESPSTYVTVVPRLKEIVTFRKTVSPVLVISRLRGMDLKNSYG